MAIWQYPIHTVPKKDIINGQGQLPSNIKIEEEGEWINVVDTSKFWQSSTIDSKQFTVLIDKILPRDDWSNSEEYAGWKGDTENNEDNDCFIGINDNIITSFSFRIDLRDEKNIKSFLVPILEVCNKYDLILVGEGQIVMEPEISVLRENLIKSKAANFVHDPKGFIEKVSHENNMNKSQPTKNANKQGLLTRIWKKLLSN